MEAGVKDLGVARVSESVGGFQSFSSSDKFLFHGMRLPS